MDFITVSGASESIHPLPFTARRLHHKIHGSIRSSLAFISVLQPVWRGAVWGYLTFSDDLGSWPRALAQQLAESGRVKVQAHLRTPFILCPPSQAGNYTFKENGCQSHNSPHI